MARETKPWTPKDSTFLLSGFHVIFFTLLGGLFLYLENQKIQLAPSSRIVVAVLFYVVMMSLCIWTIRSAKRQNRIELRIEQGESPDEAARSVNQQMTLERGTAVRRGIQICLIALVPLGFATLVLWLIIQNPQGASAMALIASIVFYSVGAFGLVFGLGHIITQSFL
jgi:hypothetical protein